MHPFTSPPHLAPELHLLNKIDLPQQKSDLKVLSASMIIDFIPELTEPSLVDTKGIPELL